MPNIIQKDQAAYDAFNAIQKSDRIGIISHRSPDPDAIGANLALKHCLKALNKQVISLCVDPLPSNSFFIKGTEEYQKMTDFENLDLIITVDCGSKSQVAFEPFFPELFSGKIPLLNIDHHSSNEHFGTINIVYPDLASTCEILTMLFEIWKVHITPEMATCLLFGLYYDTGSFMHSNTTSNVLEIAEKLVAAKADLPNIISNLYKNLSIPKLKLWGQALSNMETTPEENIVAVVTQEDFQKTHTKYEDLSGVIDYLNSVKGSNYTLLATEDGKGNIKGSLRTRRDDLNLSDMAGKYGGGGHKKASGFTVKGSLEKSSVFKVELPE